MEPLMARIEKCPYVRGKPVAVYMREEHAELPELLAAVRVATEAESKRQQAEPGEAKQRLEQFAIDLEQHLLSEERDIFPVARKLGPKWRTAVDTWVAEHAPLRALVAELKARHPRPCLLALGRMAEMLHEHSESEDRFDWRKVVVPKAGEHAERTERMPATAETLAVSEALYDEWYALEVDTWDGRDEARRPFVEALRAATAQRGKYQIRLTPAIETYLRDPNGPVYQHADLILARAGGDAEAKALARKVVRELGQLQKRFPEAPRARVERMPRKGGRAGQASTADNFLALFRERDAFPRRTVEYGHQITADMVDEVMWELGYEREPYTWQSFEPWAKTLGVDLRASWQRGLADAPERTERMRIKGATAGSGKSLTYTEVVEGTLSRRNPAWWPRIREAATLSPLRVTIPESDREAVGAGFFGVVFELPNEPEWVLKLTTDRSDAAALEAVRAAGGVPGVVGVREVFAFPGDPPVYGAVVERLSPIPSADNPYQIEDVLDTSPWSKGTPRDRVRRIRTGEGATRLLTARDPRPQLADRLDNVIDGVEALAKLGVVVHDIRYDNIMQAADGTWKISDLGVSEAPEQDLRDIERIERMAVAHVDQFRAWLQGPDAPESAARVLRALDAPLGAEALAEIEHEFEREPEVPAVRTRAGRAEDAGAFLPGARKHMWTPGDRVTLDDLETLETLPEGTQHKYLTKEHIFGKFPWEEEQANGTEAGAAVLKSAIWRAVAAAPGAHRTSRQMYLLGAAWLRKNLAGLQTVAAVHDFLSCWYWGVQGCDVSEPISGPDIVRHFGLTLPYAGMKPSGGMSWEVRIPPPEDVARAVSALRTEFNQAGHRAADRPEAYAHAQALHEKIEALEAPYRCRLTARDLQTRGYTAITPMAGSQNSMYRLIIDWPDYKTGFDHPKGYLFGLAGFDNTVNERAARKQQLVKLVVNSQWRGAFTDTVLTSAQRATWDDLLKETGGTRAKVFAWERATTGQRRAGPPVTMPTSLLGDEFIQRFRLRGDQFGGSVSNHDRQEHRRLAWLALEDLSRTTGLPPEAMGNCGILGLAFGARGKGRAGAHYESINNVSLNYFPVINLTHTRGDGSLAHEWGHFLDHHLAANPAKVHRESQVVYCDFASGGRGSPQVGDRLCNTVVAEAFAKVMRAIYVSTPEEQRARAEARDRDLAEINTRLRALTRKRRAGEIEQEPYEAEFKLVRSEAKFLLEPKKTQYVQDAGILGEYWIRPTELFARAFESFIEDTLAARNEENTYLVEGTRKAYRIPRGQRRLEPYPQGAERERINAAMADLMRAIRQTSALCGGDVAPKA